MDAKLAAFYGTNSPDEADVEKLAAAELAEKLASDESVNLDDMSEEQLEAVAQEVLADGEETDESEVSEDDETDAAAVSEPEGDAQEKLAEADYLGRVMAHAYVQELKNIEKTAAMPAGVGKVMGHLKGLGGKAKSMGAAGAAKAKAMGASGAAKAKEMGGKAKEHAKAGAEKAKAHVKAHGKAYSAGAGAAGGAAAMHAAKKMKEKKSSAVDQLVEARIAEILEASEIDPAELTKVEETKTASAQDVLAQTIEQRAWETLAQYGVVPATEETEESAEE